MKIKKILITFTCLALCLLVPVQTAHGEVLEAIGVIDTVVKAIKYTIAIGSSDNPFETAIYEAFHGSTVEAVVDQSLDNYNGTPEVRLSSYTFLTGKYNMKYTDLNGYNREVLVICSMYYTNSTPTNLSDTYPERYITGGDGLTYLTNNIYYQIYRDDGWYRRYRCKTSSDLLMSQVFNTGTWSGYTGNLTRNGVTIYRSNYQYYYDVTDGSMLGSAKSWSGSGRDINFHYSSKNSIVVNPLFNDYTVSSTKYMFDIASSAIYPYPTDEQIVKGAFSVRAYGENSSSGYNIYPSFTLAYYDTNDEGNEVYYKTNLGAPSYNSFNYYYDNSFKGGTVVNNDNKTTVLDGTLNNAFDVDGKVINLPDVSASIKPLLDVSLDHLADLITDFYNDMPDFNLPWSGGGDNDYFELTYEPPDSGGGNGDITVIVTVDVPRPLVTTMTYTTPLPPVTLPTMTTYTLPAAVIDSSDGIKSYYDVIFDETGLLPIFGFLALVGVGCAIIFKGV